MNIKEIMNSAVKTVTSCTSLKEAAEIMEQEQTGFLIVASNDELLGTVTDRDIVLRAVSQGRNIEQTTVGEVMTVDVLYCHEEHTVDEVARHMSEEQVLRMPVVNSDNKLTGIITIGDMAQHLSPDVVGHALEVMTDGNRAA